MPRSLSPVRAASQGYLNSPVAELPVLILVRNQLGSLPITENRTIRARSPTRSKAHPQPWPARTPGEHHGPSPPPAAPTPSPQEIDSSPCSAPYLPPAPVDDPSPPQPWPATPASATSPSVYISLAPHKAQ